MLAMERKPVDSTHDISYYRKAEKIIFCTEGKSGEDVWYQEAGTKLIAKP